jgi:hypothetical protein
MIGNKDWQRADPNIGFQGKKQMLDPAVRKRFRNNKFTLNKPQPKATREAQYKDIEGE